MSSTTINNDIEVQKVERPRLLTFLFGFCMFSTGASGLINEYVLATMSTYILGNSIEQFSVIIGSMMFMMGISGWVQEKISDKNLIAKFMGIEIIMALLGGFAPIAIYAAFGYVNDHFLLVHYFFVLSIGFLIGFEIPIVTRIINEHGVSIRKNLKIVYAMDYIGAFIGCIVWIEFLLKNFPLTEIGFIVSGTNFLVAGITVIYFIKKGVIKNWRISILLLTVTAGLLFFGYANNRIWSVNMEQKFYEDPIVHVETTKYQHLVLTENTKTNDIRLYINGNTQFSSSDEKRYHDLLVHPAFALNPYASKVLVLGGGDGLALREILKYPRVDKVSLVDLDPAMVQFASTNEKMRTLNRDSFSDARVFAHTSKSVTGIGVKGVYMETGKIDKNNKPKTELVAQVQVYNVDADRFVSEIHEEKWDVIIIDFPDPSSVELAKLYSREFYRKLQWMMDEDTIIAIQSTSPYHAKEAYLTIQRTMEAAGLKTLPYRQNIPSFGDWGYFLAWKSNISNDSMKDRIKKIKDFQVETEFLNPETLTASLAFGKGELKSKRECVNSLMNPCLLDDYTNYSWYIE